MSTDPAAYDAIPDFGLLYDAVAGYSTRSDVAFYVREAEPGGPGQRDGAGLLPRPRARRPAERHVQAFDTRWYLRAELVHLLARGGFRVTAIHGDFGGAPLDDGSPRWSSAPSASER